MPIRINGGVFNSQVVTGGLAHYVVSGADFSGAINSFGYPVPYSCAEIIFNRIESGAYIDIMNPNSQNLSFALEVDRSVWNQASLQIMIQSLGTDVGVDHVDCSLLTVQEVPYIWGQGGASNTFSTISVPSQPSISATGNDTLTFVPGSNVVITTDTITKSITINASGSASSTDYIPIPPGTVLQAGNRYFVTSPGTVRLPPSLGLTAGQSVIISKKVLETIFVNVNTSTDIIATDLGTTDLVEFDATQEIILVFDGLNTWNLQIGSYIY